MASSIVSFNVGGTFFSTTRDTVMKEPTNRLAMIVKGIIPAVQDTHQVYFLDRDPKHFQLLLNWLRDGWCSLPAHPESRAEVALEARHYALSGMEIWMRTQDLTATATTTSAYASPTRTYTALTRPAVSHFAHHHRTSPSQLGAQAAATTSTTTCSPNLHVLNRLAGSTLGTSPSAAASVCVLHAHNTTPSSTGAGQQQQQPGQQHSTEKLRDAFLAATAPLPIPTVTLKQGVDGQAKTWSAKYLLTDGVRKVVDTLLELAFLAPHTSLHAGKVEIYIVPGPCDHDQASSLVGGVTAILHAKKQLVAVRCPSTGWACEFPISQDNDALFNKYALIPDFIQDNWFVITAILKDQFGVRLEELHSPSSSSSSKTTTHHTTHSNTAGLVFTSSATSTASVTSLASMKAAEGLASRPDCPTCRRQTLAVTLHKIL